MIRSSDIKLAKKRKEIQNKIIKSISSHENAKVKNIGDMLVMSNGTWEKLENYGHFTKDQRILIGNHDWVKDCWKDQPCYIVGASKSIDGFDLTQLNGKHTIGINHMIEKYDGFEFFIFLDRRFTKITTYDMNKFNGTVFYANTVNKLPNKKQVVFKKMPMKQNSYIPLHMDQGLYNGSLTGLCALHLALITGANPIYLLGCDTNKDTTDQDYHVKGYTGEVTGRLNKYIGAYGYYKSFENHKDRIINVINDGHIEVFPTIDRKKFEADIKVKKDIKNKTICHVGVMNTIDEMGDITRQVYELSEGKHLYAHIDSELPHADIYLLECFINQSDKFINFKRPHKDAKVISLIHSSSKCTPAKCSDKVITITTAWQDIMRKKGYESEMIYAGIDTSLYTNEIDYTSKKFGRITRYSLGKVHKDFPDIVTNTLDKFKDSECILFTNRFPAKHERLTIDKSIKINEHKKKAEKLSQLSIFADMHGTFIETFSLCLLEAMSAGLCIILYSDAPQPAMHEVLGEAGIICTSKKEFEDALNKSLVSTETKEHYGKLAKERSKLFTIEKMIEKYNDVFRGLF